MVAAGLLGHLRVVTFVLPPEQELCPCFLSLVRDLLSLVGRILLSLFRSTSPIRLEECHVMFDAIHCTFSALGPVLARSGCFSGESKNVGAAPFTQLIFSSDMVLQNGTVKVQYMTRTVYD